LTGSSRTSSKALLLAVLLAGCASAPRERMIHSDDFSHGLGQWIIEAEKPARVEIRDGALEIDTPAGITLWFKSRLTGPVRIEFEATAVAEGGANDQVSDLNVFWMARNAAGPDPVFAKPRAGSFAEYNDLLTYYVGLGGNRNTTTRFRRYIGDPQVRPLLPEHDLSSPEAMLVPNKKQKITLIADRHTIEYRRDGQTLFRFEDPMPYEQGWFALRSTWSHLRIDNLRIHALR
jgi:Domain of unknown function (DUF6250)